MPAVAPWAPAWGVWEVQPLAGVGNILVCIFWHIALSDKLQGSRGQISVSPGPQWPNEPSTSWSGDITLILALIPLPWIKFCGVS